MNSPISTEQQAPASLDFFVVENRQNETLASCRESAQRAGERLHVLASTDAGPDYAAFQRAYIHLSSNPPAFEMICFRRYFLLRRHFEGRAPSERFVLIDSDVLLFPGIGAHVLRLVGNADFSGSYITADEWDPCQISPHVSYWTVAGLRAFTDHVLATYTHETGIAQLEAIAERFAAQGLHGGISDMTLLHLWAQSSGNTAAINRVRDSAVIDHNINITHNYQACEFRTRGGAKQVTFVQGTPYLTTREGVHVKVMALHFQGSAKLVMNNALNARMGQVALMSFAIRLARTVKAFIYGISTSLRRNSAARPPL